MKSTNFFIALALCVAMQPGMSFGSQEPGEETTQSQTYWHQYAPQFMQDASTYVSKKYEDTIGKWTTRKKMLVASAVLTTLVGVYYRNEIMAMIAKDMLKKEYKDVAKDYLENDAAYYAAKAELRKNWTPALDQKVERLVQVDRRLGDQLYEIKKQMTTKGMTSDEIDEMADAVRKEFSK